MEPITRERWERAQDGERREHETYKFIPKNSDRQFTHMNNAYRIYLQYVGFEQDNDGLFDMKGKRILEIGPSKWSAFSICKNYGESYMLEPTIYEETLDYYKSIGVTVINQTAEECTFPDVDEIWMFNLLMHVMNPDLILNKCKETGKTIRFMEPIKTERYNLVPNNEHPFVLEEEFFVEHFGEDVVKKYIGGNTAGFHAADCSYGVYNAKID